MAMVLGVVLAGGRGTRLGLGISKAAVRLGGMTLLERALQTLHAVCDQVVVAAPSARVLPPFEELRVDDAAGAEGPLAGLSAALGTTPHRCAIALGVDFPLARPAALRELLDRLALGVALVPAPGGIPQPLFAAYGASAAAMLAERLLAGERSVTAAARAAGARMLDDEELVSLPGGLENFVNVNTPADLRLAERLVRERVMAEGAR